ncbi:MAG: hypothetical protein ACRDSR_04175 [Pseudonocardiaceae bacterium]
MRRGDEFCTTSSTLSEIRYGIERPDVAAAAHYPMIVTRRVRAGTPISGFDAQIPHICRTHDAALATHNLKDFNDAGSIHGR